MEYVNFFIFCSPKDFEVFKSFVFWFFFFFQKKFEPKIFNLFYVCIKFKYMNISVCSVYVRI